MATQLADLARLVNGHLTGDGTQEILGAATLATASVGDISLVDSEERLVDIPNSDASALVVPSNIECHDLPSIAVDDVHEAFAAIVCHFRPQRTTKRIGVSPQAIVGSTAKIAEGVDIHPHAIIGEDVQIGAGSTVHAGVQIADGCQIADNVTIFPNCVLYEDTVVGPRCIIHAGAVIGAYGFGYDSSSGRHILSSQLGYVEIGADVEIGAASAIDRGTYGPTVIGEGTKIDNLVMIAHNCRIGRHNMICSQVGVAGSTTTGDYVVLAGQVGIRDHVHIGDHAVLGAMAGVMNNVPAGKCYVGVPATPIREQKLKQAALAKLPEMRKQLRLLQKAFDHLVAEPQAKKPAA